MTRFAVVYEDPSYEEPEDLDWPDEDESVAEKPQEEFGPYETVNS